MIISSEQVGKGHPDKMADQISDIVLQTLLEIDNQAKVACETLITSEEVFIRGEINFKNQENIDLELIIKPKIIAFLKALNYSESDFKIDIFLVRQSQEINNAVLQDEKIGAGDQGIMFGFATSETKEMIGIPYLLATKILMKIDESQFHAPNYDSKSQVTFDYSQNKITHVLTSIQHKQDQNMDEFRKEIKKLILEVVDEYGLNHDFDLLINPSGSFVVGGPKSDIGLTGRKIIADTYGGFAKHGGGAFSGKDYTKVDRSAAYMLRYIAKNIVANKLANKVELQISYAIGLSAPLSINVETFGTNTIPEEEITKWVIKNFDLTPYGIRKELQLDNPKVVDYTKTSIYGHFISKNATSIFPWEITKKI